MRARRAVTLSPEEFDTVWEVLTAALSSIDRGELHAVRGLSIDGPKDRVLTAQIERDMRSAVNKMTPFVATDEEPIMLLLDKPRD